MNKYEVDFQAEDWPAKLISALERISMDAETVLNTMDLIEESIDREINGLKKTCGYMAAFLDKHPDSLFYLTGECKAIVENIRELIKAYYQRDEDNLVERVWGRVNMAEIPAKEKLQ